MATDDRQTLVTGTAPAPADWLIAGNGQIRPKTITATFDGTSAASAFTPALKIYSDGGELIGVYPYVGSVAAGASVEVSWFPRVGVQTTAGQVLQPETLFLPTWQSQVTTAQIFPAGVPCQVTVQGTYSAWNENLDHGTPQPDAVYPSKPAGVSRLSTEVGKDPETLFAYPSDHSHPIGHSDSFQIDVGLGFSHVEPIGGPYSTPQSGFFYTYAITGTGSPVSFTVADSPKSDNYGALKITITGGPQPPGTLAVTDGSTTVSGVSEVDFTSGATVTDGGGGVAQVAVSGGGGGVASVTAGDTSIVIGGTATNPTVETADLSVIASDHATAGNVAMNSHKVTGVTAGSSANEAAIWDQTPAGIVTAKGDLVVGTGSHAAARLPVGSNTQVLVADSTQTAGVKWAAGGGTGTISDITSSGGTITVGSPTGPTTNVDLPTTGVSPTTYGSASQVAQITVDAEGRITAASNVGIGGAVGAGSNVQTFSAGHGTYSWTMPSGANVVAVYVVGAGGGGGRGAAGGTVRNGGGGGGGGGCAVGVFRASDLSSPVTVTIGQGGAAGSSGGDSTFGSYLTGGGGGAGSNGSTLASGIGGGGGGNGSTGGTSVAGTASSGGGPVSVSGGGGAGGAGGGCPSASAANHGTGGGAEWGGGAGGGCGGTNQLSGNGGTSIFAGAGGGGGGGGTSVLNNNGGDGGATGVFTAAGGGGGGGGAGASGAATNGSNGSSLRFGGSGGGGGGCSSSSTGGNGGAGGTAAGGGGGGCSNTGTAGSGGAGGDGYCVVVSW